MKYRFHSHLLITLLIAVIFNSLTAQDIGFQRPLHIITNGATTDNRLILDIQSDDQGILIPRMTEEQILQIQQPADGLFVFNTDDGCLHVYLKDQWKKTCGYQYEENKTSPPEEDPQWSKVMTNIPNPRLGGIKFTIGNNVYVGSGYNDSLMSDLWKYQIANNTWTQLGYLPGPARKHASIFSVDDEVYFGLGEDDLGPRSDLWKYDISADAWDAIPDFPGVERHSAVSVVCNGNVYLGLGRNISTRHDDWWMYNPTTQAWTQRASFPPGGRYGATSFVQNGKIYVGLGGGTTYMTDLWEYDPSTNTWTQKGDPPCGRRFYPESFDMKNRSFLALGDWGGLFNDFWEYHAANDSWTQLDTFPGPPRYKALAFSLGNTIFIGGGGDYYNFRYNDLYTYNIPINHIQISNDSNEIAWIKSDTFETYHNDFHRSFFSAQRSDLQPFQAGQFTLDFIEAYDPNNTFADSVFTAPIDGTYHFSTHATFTNGDGSEDHIVFGFHVNDVITNIRTSSDSDKFSRSGREMTVSQEGILSLNAGDEVKVKISLVDANPSSYVQHRIFNGVLMSE